MACYALGSSCTLTAPLFALQQRPHGGMMSVSTRLPSPSSFLSPRLIQCFKEGDQVVIQKSTTAPDLFAVFHKYLRSCDSLFPLFPQLWLRSDGSVPSQSWFLSMLHFCFPCSIGGHSMRAGGATSASPAGVPPSQIQAIGRWTPLSTIFVVIQHCCRLYCSMVSRWHPRPPIC